MPLLHISLRAGKPEAYRQAIFNSLYRAMREALNVPEDDQFMTITEHDAANENLGAAIVQPITPIVCLLLEFSPNYSPICGQRHRHAKRTQIAGAPG